MTKVRRKPQDARSDEDLKEEETIRESGEDESQSEQEDGSPAEVPEDSEGDSDSSPEDVSFKQSKQEAMESVSAALKHMQESKKALKEKRKKHHEMLAEQKKKKLERLENKKLPEEFLKEVSQTSVPAHPPAPIKVKGEKQVHQHFDGEGDDSDSGVDESTPVGDRFYVVAAPKAEKRPHPKPDQALQFLQQSLYGRNVKRSAVNTILDHGVKKEGLPARHFRNAKEKRKRRKHGRREIAGT